MIYHVDWSGRPPPKVMIARIKMGYDVDWAGGVPTVKMSREATQEEIPYRSYDGWAPYCYHYWSPTIHVSKPSPVIYASIEMPEAKVAESYYNLAAAIRPPKPKKKDGVSGYSGSPGVSGRFYEKFVKRTARRGRNFI